MSVSSTEPGIYITVDRRAIDEALQISIEQLDANGVGHGFRIAGPKYDGAGLRIIRKRLSGRDKEEILSYLNLIID